MAEKFKFICDQCKAPLVFGTIVQDNIRLYRCGWCGNLYTVNLENLNILSKETDMDSFYDRMAEKLDNELEELQELQVLNVGGES